MRGNADYAKPEGFCDEAWKAVYQYVFALAHGAGNDVYYYGDWIRKLGVAICICNDGLRPVIFKLETTEEISLTDYENHMKLDSVMQLQAHGNFDNFS